VYGTLQQHYYEIWYDGLKWVKVTKYIAKWVLYDSSVSMKNAKINAGCLGDFFDGGVCSQWQTKSIGTPTSGNWYTLTPSWAGRYVSVGGGMFQEGNSIVTLQRGSSTWTLQVNVPTP